MQLLEFKKVTDILAREYAVQIFEGTGWAANIEHRHVFYVKNDIYDLPEDQLLGLLLHEIAHIHYTTTTPTPTSNKELHHTTMNMLEDISIENIISKDYPNAEEILTYTRKEVISTLLKILPKLDISLHEKSLLYAAIRIEGRGFSLGIEPFEIIGNKITAIMEREKNLIMNRKTTKDLVPLADEIIKLLLAEAGDLTQDEKHKMNIEANRMIKGLGEKLKEQIIGSMKQGTGFKAGIAPENRISYLDDVIEKGKMLGKKLRTILKRNNAMEFGGRFRTGKLKTKSLARTMIKKDRNPFTRRIIKSNQSYAFAIVSDVSGSMQNSSSPNRSLISYATSSQMMLGEALRIAGIPRTVIIFGENAVTIQPIGKTKLRWEDLVSIKAMDKANTSGTRIHVGVEKAMRELTSIRTEKKIMIILTDGESDEFALERAIEKATANNITCLGISLGHRTSLILPLGEKNVIQIENPNNANKIETAFINILTSTIKESK